jgi:putative transcriptional regulator
LKLPRLKEVRELHGWSQAKLAEEAGVSRDSISNYETGQREAWPATAKRLADALEVEIEDLARPKVIAPSTSGPHRTDMPPRASKERLEEHFENVQQEEVDYLDYIIADLWRLALPGEKPKAHFVPDNVDSDRVWHFLNLALTTPGMFKPEEVERINRGARKKAVAGR